MRMVASPLRRFLLSRLNRFQRPRASEGLVSNDFVLPRASSKIDACGGSYAFKSTAAAYSATAGRQRFSCSLSDAHPTNDQVASSMVLPNGPGTIQFHDYGKWSSLKSDEEWLDFESDVLMPNPQQPRLVDLPENQNDFSLWLCILEHRRHRDGLRGIVEVMEGLMARGSLFKAKSGAAKKFWQTILDHATLDKDLLENVWAYAEWLYDNHGVPWPRLYSCIIAALVRESREEDALRWHLRLSPKFGPDADEFELFLKQFIAEARHHRQRILQMLYRTSLHHQLYDKIIPYLYSKGCSQLARSWRSIFICYNDLPRSSASRPFLRFLAGYFLEEQLEPREIEVAGLDGDLGHESRDAALLEELETRQDHVSLRGLVNQTKGQTPGKRGKGYDDELGAKYFASTWVSVDFAINSLHLLGVIAVGSLTLQSIALREESTEGIKKRIQQLERAGISVGESSYARAIQQWATTGNEGLLSELIHSDMHPDIFDNIELERDALVSTASAGDWRQYELIVNLRLSVSVNLVTTVSNHLVKTALETGNKSRTLWILDMMSEGETQLLESTVDVISSHIPQNLSSGLVENLFDSGFYACLCSMMLHLQFPPSSAALQTVLTQLSRAGRFEEFHLLAREITQYYKLFRSGRYPMMRVHKSDVPAKMREAGRSHFQYIPRDLSWRSPLHPLRLVFNPSLQMHVVRRAFGSEKFVDQTRPKSLHFTDGVRLLALLRKMWAPFPVVDVGCLRRTVTYSMAEFLGRLKPLTPWRVARLITNRSRRRFRIRVAKDLIDEAWGEKLLPRKYHLYGDIWWYAKVRREAKAPDHTIGTTDELHILNRKRRRIRFK